MKKILLLALVLFSSSAHAENKKVVVSIKPLHSLVAAVMQGDGNEPVLLVDGQASAHSFSLRPSQVKALGEAAVIFYMGDGFETFLEKPLASLPANVQRVAMGKTPNLKYYYQRLESGKEAEDSSRDLHLWLMPSNAKGMVAEIARQLSMVFPEKRALYHHNARVYANRIDQMDKELERQLAEIRHRPFIVFHDAYQYFMKNYQMSEAGAISMHPERGLNAGHVSKIREIIKSSGAVCVFGEPQFDRRVVDSLLEGTSAKSGVLDPEGALLAPGPELYFELMQGLTRSLKQCLAS